MLRRVVRCSGRAEVSVSETLGGTEVAASIGWRWDLDIASGALITQVHHQSRGVGISCVYMFALSYPGFRASIRRIGSA